MRSNVIGSASCLFKSAIRFKPTYNMRVWTKPFEPESAIR